MARARLFFYRYGFASVLIGRFLGPIRSTIPTVAGVMGMAHGRFQLANVSSAILWMPLMLAPGMSPRAAWARRKTRNRSPC